MSTEFALWCFAIGGVAGMTNAATYRYYSHRRRYGRGNPPRHRAPLR